MWLLVKFGRQNYKKSAKPPNSRTAFTLKNSNNHIRQHYTLGKMLNFADRKPPPGGTASSPAVQTRKPSKPFILYGAGQPRNPCQTKTKNNHREK